jgi:hypothetical protein
MPRWKRTAPPRVSFSSPSRSTEAVRSGTLDPAGGLPAAVSTSVITPTTDDRSVWIARNFPTVMRRSSDDCKSAFGTRRMLAWEPPPEKT